MLSFAEQTYGPKGAYKIITHLDDGGQTKIYDLIERLKDKVFMQPIKLHIQERV